MTSEQDTGHVEDILVVGKESGGSCVSCTTEYLLSVSPSICAWDRLLAFNSTCATYYLYNLNKQSPLYSLGDHDISTS